ncbi:MAG TPA: hypothetical protein VH369_03455 [Bryobacteraceae bacterium]
MSLLKNRNILVSFRLAPDEYSSVTQACMSIGARSVSDFARQALLSRVQSGEASLEGDLVTIARRLKEVETALEITRALIARVLGSEPAAPAARDEQSAKKAAFDPETVSRFGRLVDNA